MAYRNIGDRISLMEEKEVFSLVILPSISNTKMYLLFFWLLAWTISGILVMINYFSVSEESTKIILIIWMAFWMYFEFKIGRAFLFRKFGKENLWIKKGKMFYQREIFGRGKTLEFNVELINEPKVTMPKQEDFLAQINESFWVISGERISFQYGAKTYRFALQLGESDSNEVLKLFKKAIHQFSN